MMFKASTRVLPADVYDTLELSAFAFGGVGCGWSTDEGDDPLCIIGHARHVDPGYEYCDEDNEFSVALMKAGVNMGSNDDTLLHAGVARYKERVSWERYCELMNIERAA